MSPNSPFHCPGRVMLTSRLMSSGKDPFERERFSACGCILEEKLKEQLSILWLQSRQWSCGGSIMLKGIGLMRNDLECSQILSKEPLS